jgi:Tfp pilus assembly protein PilV
MSPRSTNPGGASRVRRRALLGAAVLVVLVALAGLAAYLTRDCRTSSKAPAPQRSSASPSSPTAPASASSRPHGSRATPPVPPSTHDPIAFGKAAAAALWSYDTRAYSQHELLAALHRWLTSETKYADTASVDALVPSRVLWKEMAANGQFATVKVNEAHFPDSFTQALQADPGAITTAYVYAVTVSGKQSIAWKGSPHGGAENRVTTFAVQCRPSQPCALAGVLPAVAP